MHERVNFEDADPTWDDIEAGWIREMAAGGPEAQSAWESMMEVYDALFERRLKLLQMPIEHIEDSMHQTWIEVYNKAPRWPTGYPVRVYLSGFLAKAAKRYFGRMKVKAGREISLDIEPEPDSEAVCEIDLSGAQMSAEAKFDFERCVSRALDWLRSKDPHLERLLVLRHVFEWSLDEMIGLTGDEPELARSRLERARLKIAPRLKPCLELLPDYRRARS